MDTKICKYCLNEKEISQFDVTKAGQLKRYCRDCFDKLESLDRDNKKECNQCLEVKDKSKFKKGLNKCGDCYNTRQRYLRSQKLLGRKCRLCDQDKVGIEFDGVRKQCKECRKKQLELEDNDSRQCVFCKEIKPLSDFYQKTRYRCSACWQIKNASKAREWKLSHKERVKQSGKKWKKEHLASVILHATKSRAKKDNIPFNLELSDIVIPEKCLILNNDLDLSRSKRNNNSASIDKVIPNRGYIKGNVNIISDRANRLKNDGTADEHERIAIYIRENSFQDILTFDI